MLWLWLSLLSAFLFASLNLMFRISAVKSLNPRIFSFIFNFWGAIFSFIILLIELPFIKFPQAIPSSQIFLIAGALILYGIYERTHFLARKHIESSTITIIYRLSPVVTFFGSIVFFGETLTLTKFIGTLLIVLASVVIVYKNSQFVANRFLAIALFCAVILGLGWMLDKPGSQGIPASFYSLLIWAAPLVIIGFPKIPLLDLKREFFHAGSTVVFLGFLNALGYYVQIKALSLADASQVVPITSTGATLTVLGGIFILHEKSHLFRKLIAGTMIFIGVLLLA